MGEEERKQWVYEEGGLNWSPFTNSGQDLEYLWKWCRAPVEGEIEDTWKENRGGGNTYSYNFTKELSEEMLIHVKTLPAHISTFEILRVTIEN